MFYFTLIIVEKKNRCHTNYPAIHKHKILGPDLHLTKNLFKNWCGIFQQEDLCEPKKKKKLTRLKQIKIVT